MQQEVVLALLAKEPAHGYQLRARLRQALGPLGDQMNAGQVYVTLTRLEKAGLVERRSCPSDVRGVLAVLTEAGRQRLEQAAPGHVTLVRELLIDVLTPGQLASLADALGEVSRRAAART